MPTVRLEFDLDSEVYPELHATLAALNPQSRAERLRQLAASGLVWEKVRIHGPSAMASPVAATPGAANAVAPAASAHLPGAMAMTAPVSAPPPGAMPQVVPVTPPAPVKSSAPLRAAVSLDLPEPLPVLERRPVAAKRTRATPAERRRASDFVDLAISAEPAALSATPLDRPSRLDVEQVIRELPVLNDVVMDVEENEPPLAATTLADDRQAEQASPWAASSTYADDLDPLPVTSPADLDSQPDDESAGDAPPSEDALHVTALAHKPQARSRLKRMKERGLFKNG